MFKRIRYKFIAITIISLAILLSFTMIAINWTNYNSITNSVDKLIDVLEENDGLFPENQELFKDNIEAPYETRFFIAKFNLLTDELQPLNEIDKITISKEQRENIATTIYKKKNFTGYLNNYRYRKFISKIDGNILNIVIVDATTRMQLIDNFYKISIIVTFIGLSLSFIALIFLSKIVILPIKENEQKQKQFLTDASHELKTPLTIISANNELQEMINGTNEMTFTINKEVKKMTHMVKNISELSKMTEDSILNKETISKFCLSNSITDICYDFVNSFKNKNIYFNFEIKENIYFKGNELKIRELISIILDNALKYSKSTCTIYLFLKNKNIIIYQKNDSNNLTEGNMNEIFSRFYRSKEARASDIEGSGIGLSIAKEIVVIHRGKINAFADNNNFFNLEIIFPLMIF